MSQHLSRCSFLLFCTIVLGGCVASVRWPEKPRLECPEPVVQCLPGKTDEVTIDTSSSATASSPYYFAISQVEGLNDEPDEFGVSFQRGTSNEALATIRPKRGGKQASDRIELASFSRVAAAKITRSVDAGSLKGAFGGGSRTNRGDSIHFAAKPEGNISGDYDLYEGGYRNASITSASRNAISAVVPWDAQPALSPDGRSLYFASDRKGSLGGVDIWVSRLLSDGRWSDPVNLGPAVNTPCDELSPWVSGDGRWLYFSSSGHATVGGYDLFRSPILGAQQGSAKNLGRPINTKDDELFPSAPSTADPDTLIYYSSNQIGSQGFDIYVLHRLPRGGGGKKPRNPEDVTITGTVRDPDGNPVDSAIVTIERRDPPGDKDSTITNRDGSYEFRVRQGEEYELIAGSDSTMYFREVVRIPIDGRRTYTYDVSLPDTVTFRVNFPFNNATDPYEFTLDDRGLPSDLRWTEMIDNAAEFLSRLNGTGNRFEIIGHTDPVGSDAFNLDLGRRRAEFIRRELIKRGVRPEMLSVSSEGESRQLRRFEAENEQLYHARLRRAAMVRKK